MQRHPHHAFPFLFLKFHSLSVISPFVLFHYISPHSYASEHSITEGISFPWPSQPPPSNHLHMLLLYKKVGSSSLTQFAFFLAFTVVTNVSVSCRHTWSSKTQLVVFNNFSIKKKNIKNLTIWSFTRLCCSTS